MDFNRFLLASTVALSLAAAGCGDKGPATPNSSAGAAADQSKEAKDLSNNDLIGQAQGLYGEATQAIARSDFALARKDVDQLTAIRARLPAEWQSKVDELTKALAAKGK